MHTETYPLLIPLLILIPALGAFINIFVGSKLNERVSGYIGIGASVFAFILAVLIFSSQTGALVAAHDGAPIQGYVDGAQVVDPAFFDGWIRLDDGAGGFNVDIPWQFRVDTLTTVMLLVVTGVGSIIHIYSMGYMHGDPKFSRFFAYLNMFMMFMLILVTANNYLMMFVGWEGVGLMSFLLIGFWWDKSAPTGWKNSNAARKAMIVNRIGDFGVLMSVFLIFWTFGTLTFYQPGEISNDCFALYNAHLISSEDADAGNCTQEFAISHDEAEESDEAAEDHEADLGTIVLTAAGEDEAAAEDDHGEGAYHPTFEELDNSQFESPELLGVFGQVDYMTSLPEGDPGRMVDFGPFQADISDVLLLIIIFMFLGVAGKSAQIPLFIWLPDAMAGPTPVSALMHAATMVTAGIFMLVRSSVLLDAQPVGSFIVALLGALTALVAGYMAIGQWDIKRVLAYSTISQLGFMIAAVGLGAYVAAMFHLVTHALFKALLFLGSGSVIHGVEHGHHHVHEHAGHGDHDEHHEEEFDPQDMRNMGGLRGRMPVTYITYLIGTFALAGIFPFAGFWSKDEILAEAWHKGLFDPNPLTQLAGYLVLGILIVAAGFTAFYMWRQIQMVFHGDPRSDAAAHAPESVAWMTIPLVLLAIGSLFGGFLNLPTASPFSGFLGLKDHEFGHWLEATIPSVTTSETLTFNWMLAIAATVVAVGAIFLAHSIYSGNKSVVDREDDELGTDPLAKRASTRQAWAFANARMYWDETYFRLFENPYNRIAAFFADTVDWRFLHDYFHDSVVKRGYDSIGNLLANPIDLGIIDMIVNGVGTVIRFISGRSRGIQTGYVRTYALAVLLGVVAVVVVMLLPLAMQFLQNGA